MELSEIIAEVDAECRRRSIPMLGRHKAARLVKLIRETRPGLVIEVGTAIGYSGLWIGDGLRKLGKGRLITYEQDAERAAEALINFQRAGLDHLITQVVGDAREEIGKVKGRVDEGPGAVAGRRSYRGRQRRHRGRRNGRLSRIRAPELPEPDGVV